MSDKAIKDMSISELTSRLAAIAKEKEEIENLIKQAAKMVYGDRLEQNTSKSNGRGAIRRPAPDAPEEDQQAILKVMAEREKGYKSGAVSKNAGLTAKKGKAAIAALVQKGKIERKGPWIVLA